MPKKTAPGQNPAPQAAQQVLEEDPAFKSLPEDAKARLKDIKDKLEALKGRLVKRLDRYVTGVALLPPKKEGEDKDKIFVLVLIDDSDSMKMSKEELREKLQKVVLVEAEAIDKGLAVELMLLSELWQACYDAKYEVLQMIALAAPVHDTGILAAVKIAEVHKSMVLKKFEKYIVSYVLAGSLTQGRATPKSDVDVFIVIDDTDVKKMTRAELKDKLRAIIIGMGFDAGKLAGVEKAFNIQVYILTDFWENFKEANPVIFTFLRDGVPLYDRGLFMPWKQLLKMGKIKPSQEAIDMFMATGDQMVQRIKFKLKDIGMEDTYYAILTPAQSALMLYGVPPPTPKETPEVLREVFVKKEGILEEEYIKILERNLQVRKDLEHGDMKDLTGKDLDTLIADAERFLARLKKLFEQISALKEKEDLQHATDAVLTLARDVLRLEGATDALDEAELPAHFQKSLVARGLLPEKYLRLLKEVLKVRGEYGKKTFSKTAVTEAHKKCAELSRHLIEHVQRKRARELNRAKIRVRHGERFGEIILLGDLAFIIHDLDDETKGISRAYVSKDGGLAQIRESSLEELEAALAKVDVPPRVFVKERLFEHLKNIFGRDVEILVNTA